MSKDKLKISIAKAHVMRDTIKKLGLKTPDWFELPDLRTGRMLQRGGQRRHTKTDQKSFDTAIGISKEAVLIHDAEYAYAREDFAQSTTPITRCFWRQTKDSARMRKFLLWKGRHGIHRSVIGVCWSHGTHGTQLMISATRHG